MRVTAERRKSPAAPALSRAEGASCFDAREYRRLLTRSLPKVIETEEENEGCIRLLEKG